MDYLKMPEYAHLYDDDDISEIIELRKAKQALARIASINGLYGSAFIQDASDSLYKALCANEPAAREAARADVGV